MNHKITQIFPVSALRTSGATTAVLEKELAAFSPNLATNLGGTPSTPSEFKLVFGSGSSKFGTFKSSTIKQSNILSVTKTNADLTVTQQETSVKPQDVNFSCDQEYVLTLKIDEYWSKGIYQPMIQESVRVKTACCDTCSGGCDSLSKAPYLEELVDKINENALLSKYVTAEYNGEQEEIIITGNALDEFGNACVPDAVPYVFNLVRFKVAVHAGPYNTQDFDIEDSCSPWTIVNNDEIKYPIGSKAAMAEMERHFFANNLPATHEARRYWNPIYNNDSDEFLYVPSFTAASGFVMYEITYLEDSPVGFEKKTRNVHSVIVLVETGSANAAAIDVFMNGLFSTELTVNAYTTAQRDALVGMPIGTVIYNTTTAVLNVWDGTAWDATV